MLVVDDVVVVTRVVVGAIVVVVVEVVVGAVVVVSATRLVPVQAASGQRDQAGEATARRGDPGGADGWNTLTASPVAFPSSPQGAPVPLSRWGISAG